MNSVRTVIAKNRVLWAAVAAFLLPIILVEYHVLAFTHGVFSYPVDDTFIHLAIAKSIAFHHVWGISSHEFVSASSSVLYPIILSATVKIFGSHTIIPFIINLVTAIIFLAVVQKWLERQELGPTAQIWILLAVIFFTPLPVIALSGMEHTLQLLFCFLFITRFSDELSRLVTSGQKSWHFSWQLFLYGILVTATRYEGATLVAIACLIVLFHRKVFPALQLGIVSLLPILLFGIYSIYQGSYFIPNSVLLKSGAPPLTFDGLYNFFTDEMFNKLSFSIVGYNTVATQRLLFILPLTLLLFITPIRKAIHYRYMLILLMVSVLLHLLLTGRGRFPRYEAYLIGISVVVAGAVIARYGAELRERTRSAQWAMAFTALFLAFPLLIRGWTALLDVDQASINIFQQQYQMGKFLGKYYYDTPVAFNDIGAASYFTDGRNLDLWGLGNLAVTRSMKNNYYSPDFLDGLSRHDSVKIAVVFERYFSPDLLRRWNKIASWGIRDNVICADDSVSFYAVEKEAQAGLRKNLREFQPLLPAGVTVNYY